MSLIQPILVTLRWLWDPIATRINSARNLHKNLELLKDKASDLGTRRDDINHEIDQSKPEKTPTKECKSWIAKVGEMENKTEAIKQEVQGEKKCLRGLCPDIFARIELGERVVNMIEEIKVLKDKKFEDGFLTNAPPVKVEKKPVEALELTASSSDTLRKVLNKIQDRNTRMIGIWGMGGIGKTSIMLHLNNTPEIATMFDIVIWVTVSKSTTIRKLQDQIVKRLSIKITDESDDQVLEGKKYLLLLDDVWKKVDLSLVGLPNANEDNGCKVVLATRERGVCRKMGTDFDTKVSVLSDEEGWDMFYSKVGDVVMSPTIKLVAEEIVRKCGGLPLALKIVSSALRKVENVSVWKDFVREWKSPATSFIKDWSEELFHLLKVSYDQIEDTEKRHCFLYCGLYPEDHKIKKSRLIDYWRAEGLLSGKLSLIEARDKGEAILEALIDSCLLERCEGDDEHVIMHDVIRDLILAMTSLKGEEHKHLVTGTSVEEMPEDEEWTEATRISFLDHGLSNLPDLPNCQMLLTLLLGGNSELSEIPIPFFNKMGRLRVLDLSYTGIKSLPTSISNLDSLRELDLTCCLSLVELPEEVGALKGLEVLWVTMTRIKILPSWISELTALKCLQFWGSKYEFKIPCEVTCNLSQMEELKFMDFSGHCGTICESADIVAEEVSSLKRLFALEFHFWTVTSLQHFLQNSQSWRSKRLENFRFVVGKDVSGRSLPPWKKYERCLRYIGGAEEEGSILPWAIKEVLRQSNYFALEYHVTLNTLSEVGVQNTVDLRKCFVHECGALEIVVDRDGLEMDAFPNLEFLSLSSLSNLRHILCLDQPERLPSTPPLSAVNSFTYLRDLELVKCHMIKKLFSSGFMIRQLSNLVTLRVENCEGLKGMISEDEVTEYEALPKLTVVRLVDLPQFVSFFKDVRMSWPALKELYIDQCPKLRKLPFDLNSGAAVEKIIADPKWWDALEWDDNAIQKRFQLLFSGTLLHPLSQYFYDNQTHQIIDAPDEYFLKQQKRTTAIKIPATETPDSYQWSLMDRTYLLTSSQ
ncbi:hypothetical protein HYC85_011361 [Camellia sinensis]|uniref:NB-ARC domain-containing protein n=1 Tax=Camellia sinensis TaxID=4442 RepID=A0A7J7HC06_CAMSI|nr:hypothetical protein HYC85_011361 [Camellia sinensis]